MKSLFEEQTKTEIDQRIDQLHTTSTPQWGKMKVGQMLHHCQFPLQVALQEETFSLKGNWFAQLFFKKAMYNDKPWRKNLPTMPVLKVKDEKDFEKEKEILKNLIHRFHQKKDQKEWKPHPTFGKFTAEQWGKMQYKHLDHHLKQFNV